jgi:putative endonuclease
VTHAVYVLRCGDGSLYTGYTTDLDRRLREHRAGDGAKYTRGRGPLEAVHVERFDSRSAAMRREHEVKRFTKARKERLVASSPPPDVDADR